MTLPSVLPWYVAGPLIGLIVPALLLFGGKVFGLSANMRHLCAATPLPARLKPDFLRYDWRHAGLWNLVFAVGIGLGGLLTFQLLGEPQAGAHVAESTRQALQQIGLSSVGGFVPQGLFSWGTLASPAGLVLLVGGGFLVGFGARYAGGCTSGHAISGLADLQPASLVAVLGFFAGGLVATHLLLPLLLPFLA